MTYKEMTEKERIKRLERLANRWLVPLSKHPSLGGENPPPSFSPMAVQA